MWNFFALNFFSTECKCTVSDIFLKTFGVDVEVTKFSLKDFKSSIISLTNVSANKKAPNASIKMHAKKRNVNESAIICRAVAIKYPIGIFQLKGNLSIHKWSKILWNRKCSLMTWFGLILPYWIGQFKGVAAQISGEVYGKAEDSFWQH